MTDIPAQARFSIQPSIHRLPHVGVYWLALLLVAALVIGLASFTLLQERARHRERAIVATQNISTLLEQHTSDVFEQVELLVRSTVTHVESVRSKGALDDRQINRYLAQQASLMPELRGLRMSDANGVVRYGIDAGDPLNLSLADEAFFKAARDSVSQRPVVFGPIFAPIAKKWVIVFAKAVRTPDGVFAGVIHANFPTDSFETVFSSVQLGQQGAATIRGTDMSLVHRVPTTKNAVGSRNVSKELSEAIAKSPESGIYVAATALDGIERINTFQRLAQYPFYVIVGQATKDYLRGWISSVVLVTALSGFALIAAGMAAWYAYRSQKRLVSDLQEKSRIADELAQSVARQDGLNAELEVKVRQAQAATIARDAFLSHISHEMRTPLHQISGLAGLVRRQPLSDKQSEWMHKLEQASRRMTDMVDQVLEYVKLESDAPAFSHTPVNLGSIFFQIDQRWRSRMEAKGLRFVCQAEAHDKRLLGDADRIARALDALLANALEYTQQGEVRLQCELVSRDRSSQTFRFSVRDTGCGIPQALQERLFNVFERADSTSTAEHGGMGLSLAIIRKTVVMMGGDIGCDSTPDQGSHFWFTICFALSQD